VDEGIDVFDSIGSGVELGASDVFGAVEDLALKIRFVDDVEVDEAECADTGGGEVECGGRSESAGTDEEDSRVL
jgi:hypothetical protein